VRLLRIPRFNPKREVWPGGPELGKVIEAQLTPPANRAPGAPVAAVEDDEPVVEDRTAVNLLLLLR